MSEEEKKAIEYWKRDISLYHYNTQLCSEHYAQIILNLIETQQKEIEELKNTETYKIAIIDKDNYISKDKIKAKIEEVDKDENASIPDFIEYAKEYATQKLQSLLDKE